MFCCVILFYICVYMYIYILSLLLLTIIIVIDYYDYYYHYYCYYCFLLLLLLLLVLYFLTLLFIIFITVSLLFGGLFLSGWSILICVHVAGSPRPLCQATSTSSADRRIREVRSVCYSAGKETLISVTRAEESRHRPLPPLNCK